MPSPNLSEIVATTLRNRRGTLADNVLNHNALLRRLKRRGNVDVIGGGRTLVEELEYAENSTFKYYSGYETLDVSASDVFSAAEYDWKQAAVAVTASGAELRKNSGREATIRLLDRRIRNAEKTMMNNLSTGVYSDGTGSGGKQIDGLKAQVADDPATGTVGGINRASHAFWRNQVWDFSENSVEAGKTTIQSAMDALWLKCLRGPDHPDIIVGGSNYFTYYWQSLQAIQRITRDEDAGSGFRSLAFFGPGGSAPVFYDDGIDDKRMYFLNTDFLFWRVHRDANMEALERREAVNQDAIVVPLIWMGNLTMSNASLQGVMVA